MTSIKVTGLSPGTSENQVREFFSFCGTVKQVQVEGNTATVDFEKQEAVKTAVLLSESELCGSQITVVAKDQREPPHKSSTSFHDTPAGPDVPQKEKPKTAILAEYLSHGYVLSDKVIDRGVTFDQKHGVSSQVTRFISDLDNKYKISDKTKAADEAYKVSDHYKEGTGILQKYLDRATDNQAGHKVRSFYSRIVQSVADVHTEARKLADARRPAQDTTVNPSVDRI